MLQINIVDDSSFELVIVEAEALEGLIVIFLHVYWLPTILLRVGLEEGQLLARELGIEVLRVLARAQLPNCIYLFLQNEEIFFVPAG